MNIVYKKDLRHNYMVIEEEDLLQQEAYCIKMLEEQKIEGVLSLEQRFINNKILFYYDITGKQSVSSIFERAVLSYDKLKCLLSGILAALEKAYEYLLPEDDFILTPEVIYLDITSFKPELCYLSGYKSDMKNQLSTLLEYLMNKVDYNDKAAVLLVYQLYAVSKEEGFTFQQLSEIIDNHEKEETSHSRDALKKKKFEQRGEISQKVNLEQTAETSQRGKLEQGAETPQKGKLYQWREVFHKRETPIMEEFQKKKPNEKAFIKSKKKAFWTRIFSEACHQGTKPPIRNDQQIEIIPFMPERIEQEQELLVYPLMTYLLTGISGFVGVSILILGFTTRMIYNSYGNRVEYDKLIALVLIILCIEVYLMKKLWDKKNRLVKIVTKKEYLDPREETEYAGSAYHALLKDNFGEGSTPDRKRTAKQDPISYNREQERPEQNLPEEEEDNATCLLNAVELCPDPKHMILLRSLDEVTYQSIPINEFPFFIGKLRDNVDYCLEKDVISRFHAKLTREGDSYFLTDLNSKNGTFVNQEALQIYEPKEIKFGDEIAFANMKFHFTKSPG